jgi:hypothetical protein
MAEQFVKQRKMKPLKTKPTIAELDKLVEFAEAVQAQAEARLKSDFDELAGQRLLWAMTGPEREKELNRQAGEWCDRAEQAEHALTDCEARMKELEMKLRTRLWLGHGCTAALYGDDGEMQCGEHGLDFKRMPLAELEQHVEAIQLKRIAAAIRADKQEGT